MMTKQLKTENGKLKVTRSVLLSMMRTFFWGSALFFGACSDHSNVVDPSTDESIAGWFRKETSGTSSTTSGMSSASGASSSGTEGTDSSGSAQNSSSGTVEPSSSSTASSQVIFNTQSCIYTAGTLACSEKTYKTVTIGTQTLMAENLNIGTWVPGSASSANQANDAVIEKYCYSDTETNCTTDGGLYQWSEAMGLASTCKSATCGSQIATGHHRGICPVGWHIPKTAEWDQLATYLGGASVAGKKMKLKPTDYTDWDASTYNDGNSSGFSALPAGFRYGGGGFNNRGRYAYFWEASEYNASYANLRYLYYGNANLDARNYSKTYGFSVRCFRDD